MGVCRTEGAQPTMTMTFLISRVSASLLLRILVHRTSMDWLLYAIIETTVQSIVRLCGESLRPTLREAGIAVETDDTQCCEEC